MKLYIAGPMTGIVNFNRPAFRNAQITLEDMGHDVFNPGNHSQEVRHLDLAVDLHWICLNAEGVVMLLDWGRSSGANAELATAKALDIPVWYQCATNPSEFISYDRFDAKGRTLYLRKAS